MNRLCPACQSPRTHWHLRRSQARGTPGSAQRFLQWGCRECDHQWTDPLGTRQPQHLERPPLPRP